MSKNAEVRVFLSSTFRDLNHEREVLMKKIFPEIKAICRAKGITVTEVDLRWGITDEEAVLGRIMRTCMEEIDRCRPYFIGFLGGRYGYIPDYVEISKDAYLLSDYPWMEDAILDELSITEMEFRYGGLDEQGKYAAGEGMLPHPLFYFKKTIQANEDTPRIAALQNTIVQKGIEVKEFADAEEFGKMVYDDFLALIARDFPDAQQETELDRIRAYHRAFAESRRRSYIPNMQYVKTLNEWVKPFTQAPEADHPVYSQNMVVHAPSGTGKSALLAFWTEQFRKRNPDALVVEHYIGIGANTESQYEAITHLLHEIKQHTQTEAEIPRNPNELERSVAQWLGYLKTQPTLWVIDGVNQLSEHAQLLGWIPQLIPNNIKILLSTTDANHAGQLNHLGWQLLQVQPLSEREREALTVRYLSEYSKSLPAELVKHIAANEKTATPLFLRVLLEELRLHGQHESLSDITQQLLSNDSIDDLFQAVLHRLEHSFGTEAVQKVMTNLWVSRYGLNEDELSEVCHLSRVKLSGIISAFDYHLLRKSGTFSFFHDYLRNAVHQRYLADQANVTIATQQLLHYFEKKINDVLVTRSDASTESESTVIELRILSETGWLMLELNEYERLAAFLSNLQVMPVLCTESDYDFMRLWSLLEQKGYGYFDHYAKRFAAEGIDIVGGDTVYFDQSINNLLAKPILAHPLSLLLETLFKRSLNYKTENIANLLCAFYQHTNQQKRLIDLLIKQSHTQLTLSNLAEAENKINVAFELLAKEPDLLLLSKAYIYAGDIALNKNHLDEAMEAYATSLGLAEQIKDEHIIEISRKNIGFVHYFSKRYTEALDCYLQNLAYAQRTGNKRNLAEALGNIASLLSETEQFEESISYYQQVIGIANELGAPHIIALVNGNMGSVYFRTGQKQKAIECYDITLEILRVLKMRDHFVMSLIQQSSFLLAMIEEAGKIDKEVMEKIDQNLAEAVKLANDIQRLDFVADVEYLFWRTNRIFNQPEKAEHHRLIALNQLIDIGEENLRQEQKHRIKELQANLPGDWGKNHS